MEVELAVPELGAEVEVGSKRRKTASKKAAELPKKVRKPRRSLQKKEKLKISNAVSREDVTNLTASALQQVDNELHLDMYPDRAAVWGILKISDSFPTICECLKKMYSAIYMQCSVGSEKHSRFQFQWYQQCRFMLIECTTDINYHPCLDEAVTKWAEFKNVNNSFHNSHLNAVMISIQSAVFDYLSKRVAQEIPTICIKKSTDENVNPEDPENEPDDVYWFGGAAIAEMLKNRYHSVHTCPYSGRSKILTEITVVKALECKDKTSIPASLKYRDRGFMYFPDLMFIPFIKAVDNKVRTIANNDGIQ